MDKSDKGKKFISDLKLYTDYLKYDEERERYETWEEACDQVLETHYMKYGDVVNDLLNQVRPFYHKKQLLASQRNLQFRKELILKNNAKLYNCCTTYCYSPDVFDKGFFVLLSGTGLGVSLKNKFVSQLPNINKRLKGTKTHIVEDSIEGWAKAINILISSYCEHESLNKDYYGYEIKFDYSLIRPKGAFITGGFQAPGHIGLKQSIERIEEMYEYKLQSNNFITFDSITAYDTFMHLSDAVLSGGVRRSAMNVIIDEDDIDMLTAKIGNWRQTHPWRARSNNSVGLMRGTFTKERFDELVSLNEGDNDIGFVLMSHEDDMFNPCFEISFNFYEQIKNKKESVFQFCNLNELNASACVDEEGNFSEDVFYDMCAAAAILGTLQAGYTSFPYLGKQTEEIVAGEALLGVSITGWMTRPELFDERILTVGSEVVKINNKGVAEIIGINQAARTTCVKPSGNASVILQTASGIHPEHSEKYFRIMQLNKDSETAKWMLTNRPEMIENSVWSSTGTDYVVYSPCVNPEGTLYKEEMQGVKHLKLIELVQNSWVTGGKNEELCYNKDSQHNVSNTVIIDNKEDIVNYIFNNQDSFTAVSFLSMFGDKDYNQAPFTSVLNTEEIFNKYGEGTLFMSGLIVDGLHYFNNDLWNATQHILNKELQFTGDRTQVLLKKEWVRRSKQFANNYFNKDIKKMVYCMKDVHLWHKWNTIQRNFRPVDFTKILTKPRFTEIDTLSAISCAGGSCEI
jgi:ribonucleoside-diphosphate reductase alpha chain